MRSAGPKRGQHMHIVVVTKWAPPVRKGFDAPSPDAKLGSSASSELARLPAFGIIREHEGTWRGAQAELGRQRVLGARVS